LRRRKKNGNAKIGGRAIWLVLSNEEGHLLKLTEKLINGESEIVNIPHNIRVKNLLPVTGE